MKKLLTFVNLTLMCFFVNSAFAFDAANCPSVQEINANATILNTVHHQQDVIPDYLLNNLYFADFVYSTDFIKVKKYQYHLSWIDFESRMVGDEQQLQFAQNAAQKVDTLYVASEVVVPKEYREIECVYILKDDPQYWIFAKYFEGKQPSMQTVRKLQRHLRKSAR